MTARILQGDCLQVMLDLALAGEQVDAIVTDPPYHLTSIVERFGKPGSAPAKSDGETGVYARASKGFMGKEWDGGDIAFQVETWRRAYDLLKPGGHLLAFSGSRTYHRMVCAIEDAGFDIRDQIMWLYGAGFPKAEQWTQAKADKGNAESIAMVAAGYEGWARGGLKPSHEPIVVARKPLIGTVSQNVLTHGTGAINIDACRVATEETLSSGRHLTGDQCGPSGYATSNRSEYQQNTAGRWPANCIHDGSDEVLAAFAAFGERTSGTKRGGNYARDAAKSSAYTIGGADGTACYADTGTAARFFYSAKASKADRAGSKHPTVKPISLMRYLCKLVTPPGGTVLDMFAGSGTTLQAAVEEGFNAIGIEREDEYVTDIKRRLGLEDEIDSFLAELFA